MGLYFPLFNFTIVFTPKVLIMNEPKKLNHLKIVLSHVGSVTEWSGAASAVLMAIIMNRKIAVQLLPSTYCYFTIFVAAWWLEQAANSTQDKKRNLRKVNSQASEDI